MRRRRRKLPLSLFSFQDIVTGMCGIVILFVLVMLADLASGHDQAGKPERTPSHEIEVDVRELRLEIEKLRFELARLREDARKAIVASKEQLAPEKIESLHEKLSERERELSALLSQLANLRARVAAVEAADTENRKKIKEMEATRRLLEGKLAALSGKRGVTLIPERGEFKAPVYLVLGRGGVEMLRPLQGGVQHKWYFDVEVKSRLRDDLSTLDHTIYSVVLLVRPSGVRRMSELVDMAKSLGLAYGRDPLEEDIDVYLN